MSENMSVAKPFRKLIKCVILDLDGTLINTDGIVGNVLKVVLGKFGKEWDGREAHKIVGKTPFEAAAAVVEDYGLSCSTIEFISEISPLFSDQWCNIKALPGANRLIKHLKCNGIPMALASNSPRESIEAKISFHDGWKDSFSVIIGGDEVRTGKPSPDIFLEAAKRLSMEPSSCLVIEDSLPGVTAGKVAEMEVVAVPSLPKQSHLYTAADEVINSLLDLHLEKWGLPPFADWVEGTLPIDPWYIDGPVIKGFGRGSKVLGIPTANLSAEGHSDILAEHPAGVYFGWAGLSGRGIFKMVMSIGWNPYFDNKEKTIEPWLLHDFTEDFYGEELQLVIVGYIRPEVNFPSLESLIAKIHEDRKVAERALDLPLYSSYKNDSYFRSSWSPDGSSFLTSSEDNSLRLFTLPGTDSEIPPNVSDDDDSFAASLVMSEGESIHDFCWYPYMSASDPVTSVFATTTRDHPIHLWDATSGQLRCTYRAYDAMDEITTAFSIAFNPAGTKIFAGYNKCIRLFDLHRPGRDFELYSTVKDKKEGQPGIISAMAFSPSHAGLLALGSYSQTAAVYREDNMEILYVLHGHEGGITHVQFSRDGNYLYTGGRKDPYILCWDVRKAVDCVYKLYRSAENTNQRILFDIDPSGRHLGTGGQDGLVHIYDLQTGQWVSSFEAALDTVNGFSFHPFLPQAVSSSGYRRFVIPDDSNGDLCLSGRENCVSVWSFCYYDSRMEMESKDDDSFTNQSGSGGMD